MSNLLSLLVRYSSSRGESLRGFLAARAHANTYCLSTLGAAEKKLLANSLKLSTTCYLLHRLESVKAGSEQKGRKGVFSLAG